MSDKRQKNQLVLAFAEMSRSEAPRSSAEGTESPAAKRGAESPASIEQLMEGVSVETMVQQLNRYLIGWRGYFGFCQTPSVLRSLEEWLRRRLRSVIWKQWRRGTVRFAELQTRGVGKALAAQTAGSPHGPWRLSNSPALAIALPNAYFAALGLPSLVRRA